MSKITQKADYEKLIRRLELKGNLTKEELKDKIQTTLEKWKITDKIINNITEGLIDYMSDKGKIYEPKKEVKIERIEKKIIYQKDKVVIRDTKTKIDIEHKRYSKTTAKAIRTKYNKIGKTNLSDYQKANLRYIEDNFNFGGKND